MDFAREMDWQVLEFKAQGARRRPRGSDNFLQLGARLLDHGEPLITDMASDHAATCMSP